MCFWLLKGKSEHLLRRNKRKPHRILWPIKPHHQKKQKNKTVTLIYGVLEVKTV